jgi:chaperonin GroEL
VGVIYVGAQSDIELKEKKDRVDDAVFAVRAALEEGVLPGGGVALKDAAIFYKGEKTKAFAILQYALVSPIQRIIFNAGMGQLVPDLENLPEGYGLDVVKGDVCDMVEAGIIDPTKVTKSALMNAVSVATTLLSTNSVINNVRAQ